MPRTLVTSPNRTLIEQIERDVFAAFKALAVSQGYAVAPDGAVLGKNALTGQTVLDKGRATRWSDIMETADGELAIADPRPFARVDDSFLRGARLRAAEIKEPEDRGGVEGSVIPR